MAKDFDRKYIHSYSISGDFGKYQLFTQNVPYHFWVNLPIFNTARNE